MVGHCGTPFVPSFDVRSVVGLVPLREYSAICERLFEKIIEGFGVSVFLEEFGRDREIW